jgi:hypothetical protein
LPWQNGERQSKIVFSASSINNYCCGWRSNFENEGEKKYGETDATNGGGNSNGFLIENMKILFAVICRMKNDFLL